MRRLEYNSASFEPLTHYAFRFPAKFHPPVARKLIEMYTRQGERVLDPLCGSGTLLIEAAVAGRHAIGSDVDPVAAFVSKVKTHRFNIGHLRTSVDRLLLILDDLERSADRYEQLKFCDISEGEMARAIDDDALWVPEIPNLPHWFRRYVIVDLARLLQVIQSLKVPSTHRDFFRLCFAAILRSASNADPVPVSGLEVTSHMKRLDEKGRRINAFELFRRIVARNLQGAESYTLHAHKDSLISVFQEDAVLVARRLKKNVDVVITSPPYSGAVDYYRRHQLEMYWLGFTANHSERLDLLQRYIGRPKVAARHKFVRLAEIQSPLARRWHSEINAVSSARGDAFKHYIVGMQQVVQQLARVLSEGKKAIIVVGHSRWNGNIIPVTDIIAELCCPYFISLERLWYPIVHRYMSYSRHNDASIDLDYALVLERTSDSILVD